MGSCLFLDVLHVCDIRLYIEYESLIGFTLTGMPTATKSESKMCFARIHWLLAY